MNVKNKSFLSGIILEFFLLAAFLLLSGLLQNHSLTFKLLIIFVYNLIQLGLILLLFNGAVIKSVKKISRNLKEGNFSDTGFNFLQELQDSFRASRKEYKDILGDVRTISNKNFILGEELSSKTILSLSQVRDISSSINRVSSDIKTLDNEIISSSGSINTINDNIKKMALQINQQSESLEIASAAVEEMTSSSDNIARITRSRTKATSHLVSLTKTGEEKLKLTNVMIEDISNRSGEILHMIELINDIASRTNLLAINASIEAAHAGDAGKGFAVVANEIRHLAENTAQNVNNISDVLQEITDKIMKAQNASNLTREAFQEITSKTREVSEGLNEVSYGMDELVLGEKEILQSTTDLLSSSKAIEVVSDGIKEKTSSIEQAMDKVKSISSETAARIDEVSKVAVQLNSVSMESSTLVSQNLINMENLSRSTGKLKQNTGSRKKEKMDIGISWSDDLTVQDSTIDGQHKELISGLNDFLRGMISGDTTNKMDSIIKKLNDYVVFHFSDEEEFLEKNGYPGLMDHKKIHRAFVDRLKELSQQYYSEGGSPELVALIQKDIALGLIRHIYNVDMKFKQYFESRGIQR
ncbi:MAG: hypothetical protein B6241_12765 [Spirochaetaceae bacterium 4572_59]|nr:MAG: hypothetical protein B6241_12765 [Spirochaetaceae bacterium 4572_59]